MYDAGLGPFCSALSINRFNSATMDADDSSVIAVLMDECLYIFSDVYSTMWQVVETAGLKDC